MLVSAAIAVATVVSPARPAEPRRQATATVRIVSTQPLHFAEIERTEPERLRTTAIRGRDGQPEPARLYEYQ